MPLFETVRRLRDILARRDTLALGDFAVLKTDLAGVDVRPALRPLLEPVRGWLPPIDLDALAALPPNTFGHAYARFMRANGLAPFTVTDAIDPAMRRRNAFGIRYATTHDMFHVLLDYGASWPGEMGVLAFAIGQGYTRSQLLGGVLAWLIYPFRCRFALG
ncbi:MAG: Coq4 family protein, partial [Myxococcota bacterium]